MFVQMISLRDHVHDRAYLSCSTCAIVTPLLPMSFNHGLSPNDALAGGYVPSYWPRGFTMLTLTRGSSKEVTCCPRPRVSPWP